MGKKKFICPECKVSFTTRKDAKKHMGVEGHKGGVVVSFVEAKSNKEATGMRVYWHCPGCKSKFKTEKAVRQHMKDKNHAGTPTSKPSGVVKKKDVVVVEEPKKEEAPVRTFCRISESHWNLIENELPEGVIHHVNPANDNHIMDYTNNTQVDLDYLFFKYDFVEIEMENADVIYCLSAFNPDWDMMGYDMAEHLVLGIIGVDDDGHIIIDHSNYTDETLLDNAQLIAGLAAAPQDNLTCMKGVWIAPPKPVVKPTYSGGRGSGQYSGYYGGLTGYAAEEYGHTALAKKTFTKPSQPIGKVVGSLPAPVRPPISKQEEVVEEPVELKGHPVYKIDEHFIYCDRVVDYEIYIN